METRRYILLGFIILSVIIPLIDAHTLFTPETPNPLKPAYQINIDNVQPSLLPEINITGTQASSQSEYYFSWQNIISIIYLAILTFLLFRLGFQLLKIGYYWKTLPTEDNLKTDYNLCYTNGKLPTFSFLGTVFFDETTTVNEEEKIQILDHEYFHIRQYHSIDIILIELYTSIMWFNPFVWLIGNELKNVHEYLADRKVLNTHDFDNYKSLLARVTLANAGITLGNPFNTSQSLKRIKMMNLLKKRPSKWKIFVITPLVITISFLFACTEEVFNDMQKVNETFTQVPLPDELKEQYNKLQRKSPDVPLMYAEIEGIEREDFDRIMRIQNASNNKVLFFRAFEDRGTTGVIFVNDKDFEKFATVIKSTDPSDSEIFTVVDNPAEPIGGYQEFYQYVANNLKYPIEAIEKNVEGRAFVQFVVNEQGKLEDVKVIKGLGYGMDEEAKRVVENSDLWKPAQQKEVNVKQRIVIPINFKLKKDSNSKLLDGEINEEVELNSSHLNNEVFTVVEKTAKPKNGFEDFYKYIAENMTYPKEGKEHAIEGKVFVQFEVNKNGEIQNVISKKGPGYGLDEEAIRVIKNSPNWIPAFQKGQKVVQRIILPINFELPK